MKNSYSDIRDRLPEDPQWWDENGVPRYCEFTPQEITDIYADECVLMLIQCQNCRQEFIVGLSNEDTSNLADLIEEKEIYYGDPPNIGCCSAGAMMNSIPVKILQYWTKNQLQWQRDESLEIDVTPSWATQNIENLL